MINNTWSNKCLFTLLLFATGLFRLQAAEVLVISEQEDDFNYMVITQFLDIMVDSSGTLTVDQVSAAPHNKAFTTWPHPNQFLKLTAVGQVHWVRFHLKKLGPLSKPFIMENLDQHIEHFELYVPGPDGFYKQSLGYAEGFDSRLYQHKNFVFDIPLTDSVQTFYAKIQSSAPNPLIFKVRPVRYFLGYAVKEYYILGLFYGVLAIMILYNLAIFLGVRSKLYLYYCGYVLFAALVAFSEDGLGFQFLWPQVPEVNGILGSLAPVGLLVFFSLYSASFLELRTRFPKLIKVYWGILISYCIYYFVAGMTTGSVHSVATYLVPYLIMYALAWVVLVKGHRQARFYLVGHSVMLMGIVFLALRLSFAANWGNIFTVYSFQIGTVFEIVLFSLALSDRLKAIEQAKQAAKDIALDHLRRNEMMKENMNQELRSEVERQTKELSEGKAALEVSEAELREALEELKGAHEKLKTQADQIDEMNALLKADNRELQADVKSLEKARALGEDLDVEGFKRMFPDDEHCYRFLADLKWQNGYKCKKCGNTTSSAGKDPYSCRCSKCGYLESSTVDTLFHRLRFPISKAFYIVFLTYSNKGDIASTEIAELTQIRLSTVWNFKKKVEQRMGKRRKKDGDGWAYLLLN